jgi:hypothetical protein
VAGGYSQHTRRKTVKQRNLYVVGIISFALILIGVTFAQHPETNIDPTRHPNLAAAQHHIVEAIEKTAEAQHAYKDELGGHAEKAKQLLGEASRELKEAADYADQHRK